jgi:hypothetical protein
MGIPTTHNILKNFENEMLLKKTNKMIDMPKVTRRKPIGTGKKYSIRVPVANGSKSLKKGIDFDPGLCRFFLYSTRKKCSFL